MAGNGRPRSSLSPGQRYAATAVMISAFVTILVLGGLLQRPVMQVYWAVYARLHPMRDYVEGRIPIPDTGGAILRPIQLDGNPGRESSLVTLPGGAGTAQWAAGASAEAASPSNAVAVGAASASGEREQEARRLGQQEAAPESVVLSAGSDARDKLQVGKARPSSKLKGGKAAPWRGDEDSTVGVAVEEAAENLKDVLAAAATRTAAEGDARRRYGDGNAAEADGARIVDREAGTPVQLKPDEPGGTDMQRAGTAGAGRRAAPANAEGEALLEEVDAALRQRTQAAGAGAGAAGASDAPQEPAAIGLQLAPVAVATPGVKGSGSSAEDYALTKELVASVAREGLVMVTWANFHYLDFVRNWINHVQGLGISNYLVGAMDDKILQALAAGGVNVFSMATGLTQGDYGWGSATFHKMGREKIALIDAFTRMGFDILVSDVDTMWLKDPRPYMAQFPDADILTSSDHLANTTATGGLEPWPDAGSAFNIGIMLFRPSAQPLAEEWRALLDRDAAVWDQNAFNDLARRGITAEPRRPDNLFRGYDGKLLIGILPVATFASGHTFFVQHLAERMGLEPYVVHATFQFSGTPGKRHRMREAGLWSADPPEYYAPEGGVLDFDLQLAPGLVHGSPPSMPGQITLASYNGHFRLVNAQLAQGPASVQIRAALALASALNRTLVIPGLTCGADRWWAPHAGRIPGSHFPLPFTCPMDHVLDLEQMSRELPANDFGPNLAFREHSFLANAKAAATAADVVDVIVCQDGQPGCADGSAPAVATGGALQLAPGLTDEQLRAALVLAAGNARLHFRDVRRAFGGFARPEDAAKFERRTKLYGSLWCCVDAHPGHVWYDLWWDTVPHTDRHSRRFDQPWGPQTGP